MRWAGQPTKTATVIKNHPLLRGKATHVFVGDHSRNLVDNVVPTFTGTAGNANVRRYGTGIDLSTTQDQYTSATGVNTGLPWTYACVLRNISNTASRSIAIIADGRTGASRDRCLEIYSTFKMRVWVYNGAAVEGCESAHFIDSPITVDNPRVVVCSCDGSTLRIWDNGRFNSAACTTTGVTSYATPVLILGRGSSFDAGQTSISIVPLFIRLDGLAWGETEAQAFTRDPWQVFWKAGPPVRRFAPTAAGASFGAYWANSANTMIQTPTT